MQDSGDLTNAPAYRATMERLRGLKKTNRAGTEYWRAREIYGVLGYQDWDGFFPVLKKAMDACEGVGSHASHHFRQTSVMMKVGKGAQRTGIDFFLDRTACDLVAMNGDSSKAEIAAAQAYFAVQTRRMELTDQNAVDLKRLELRTKVAIICYLTGSSFPKINQ